MWKICWLYTKYISILILYGTGLDNFHSYETLSFNKNPKNYNGIPSKLSVVESTFLL